MNYEKIGRWFVEQLGKAANSRHCFGCKCFDIKSTICPHFDGSWVKVIKGEMEAFRDPKCVKMTGAK